MMAHTYSIQILFCILGLTLGDNVVFKVTPQMIEPMVTETLTLTCGYNESTTTSPGPTDITKLVSISISQDGQDLATVTQFFPVKPIGNQSDFKVTGEIVGNSGYIDLNNQYPMGSQSGSYQCLVAGIDTRGHPHTLSKIIQVNANEVTYQDMISEIRHLKIEKGELESLINATNTRQDTSISTNTYNLAAQKSSINGLIANATTLRNNVNGLEQRVSILESAVNAKVYFTAWLSGPSGSRDIAVTKDAIVIYGSTINNYGNDYNINTGKFVCSQPGVYLFIAHTMNAQDKYAELHISYNDKTDRYGDMLADDQNGWTSASASVIFNLSKGDTVQVKASYDSHLFPSIYNSFTGVLLSVW